MLSTQPRTFRCRGCNFLNPKKTSQTTALGHLNMAEAETSEKSPNISLRLRIPDSGDQDHAWAPFQDHGSAIGHETTARAQYTAFLFMAKA
jgi:hypothetical protein